MSDQRQRDVAVGADVASVEQAVHAAKPFVLDRDPWQSEAIARDYFQRGLWDFRPMTGHFAFAGIDMALWDLCGKVCGPTPGTGCSRPRR